MPALRALLILGSISFIHSLPSLPSFRADVTFQCNPCKPYVVLKEECTAARHPGCTWSSEAYKKCHRVGCQKGSSPTPPPGPPPTPPPHPSPPTPPTPAGDPSYDHQSKRYTIVHTPERVGDASSAAVTPYFSPDHSTDTITAFIDAAKSTLDIGTPGFSSWSGCTKFSGCVGCSAKNMSDEAFPVFQALLNAVHRGVTVRLLTNDYGTLDCDGSISPLPFLLFNKISVRYYASTTFYHAKYMSRDGKAAAVSSINYSKTSFTKNREAGLVIEGSKDAVKFMTAVYEDDWARGFDLKVNQTYSTADMAIITAKDKRSYSMPDIEPGMSPTATPKASQDVSALTVWTSPDHSYDTLMSQLRGAAKSIEVEIYQVTDDALCSFLEGTAQAGISLKLLVSRYIYGTTDHTLALACYKKLEAAGVTVRMTQNLGFYQYCHQKFWIVDGVTVGLSTGNWSPSDYPQNYSGVPHGQDGWKISNRDYTVAVTSPELVSTFQTVLDKDYAAGTDFSGGSHHPMLAPLLLSHADFRK